MERKSQLTGSSLAVCLDHLTYVLRYSFINTAKSQYGNMALTGGFNLRLPLLTKFWIVFVQL